MGLKNLIFYFQQSVFFQYFRLIDLNFRFLNIALISIKKWQIETHSKSYKIEHSTSITVIIDSKSQIWNSFRFFERQKMMSIFLFEQCQLIIGSIDFGLYHKLFQ